MPTFSVERRTERPVCHAADEPTTRAAGMTAAGMAQAAEVPPDAVEEPDVVDQQEEQQPLDEPAPDPHAPVIIDGIELGAPHTWPYIAGQNDVDRTLSAKFRERPDAAFSPDPRWDTYQNQEHEWEAKLPSIVDGIASYDAGVTPGDDSVVESLLAALGRDGAVVLTGLASAQMCAGVETELAPYVPHVAADANRSKSVGAVVARSPASHELVAHPILMRLMDALIGRQVLRMDARACERLTRSTPGSSVSEGGAVTGPTNPANFPTHDVEKEEDAHAEKAPTAGAAKAKQSADAVEIPKATMEDDAAEKESVLEGGDADSMKTPATDEMPSGSTDNLSRTLMQMPWGLDCTQLVVRATDAGSTPLTYNGAATIWDLHDSFEHKVEVAVALDESYGVALTEKMTAAIVVPGSHKWPRDREPDLSEAVLVNIPKGAALITVASTWHGMTAVSQPNIVKEQAPGAAKLLRLGYNASLLRSEENMFMSNPPEIATHYPEHIQRLVGYTVRGANCGTFCDFQHPREALQMASVEGFEDHHSVDWARPETRAPAAETTTAAVDRTPHCLDETACDHGRWDRYESQRYEWIRSLPPAGKGPLYFRWDATDPTLLEQLVAALDRDGCVILTDAVEEAMCQQIMHDMEPYVECAAARSESRRRRNGQQRSVRADALPARSEASWGIVSHPAMLGIAEAILGRQVCNMSKDELLRRLRGRAAQLPWLLNLTQIIQVTPGSGHQGLHRDDGVFAFETTGIGQSSLGNLEYELSSIWALHEFTAEVGATRVVPGSHRWPPYRKPKDDETYQAIMPAGSCVIYTGKTFHSSAENSTEQPRWGLNVDFLPAIVTEEEVAWLSHPPHVARRCPENINRICGYDLMGPQLGYFGDSQHPTEMIESERPLNWASTSTTTEFGAKM